MENRRRKPKLATEKELYHDNFNVVIGTEFKNTPKSVYINYKLWLAKKDKTDMDWVREMNKIDKFMRQYSYNITSNVLPSNLNGDYFEPERTVVRLKYPTSEIGYREECYIELEITVFQNGTRNIEWDSSEMKTLFRELNYGITHYLKNHEKFKIGKKGKVIK